MYVIIRSHLKNKCHWIIMNHPPAPTKRIRSSCHSWVSRLCFAWRNLLLSHFLLVFLEDSAHPDRFIQDPWSKAKPPEWLNNGIQQQVRSALMMLHDCFMFHTTTINLEASSIFIILSPIVLGIPWYIPRQRCPFPVSSAVRKPVSNERGIPQ